MYGLLIENLVEYVKGVYGEETWEQIRKAAGFDQPSFSTHQVYPENYVSRLAKKACEVLEMEEKDFMKGMGEYFVGFVGQYGYDRVLSVLGRNMRDFLNGLDNLHEYLKFSYPKMRAPSFFCDNETSEGLVLHYRSKRRGFVYYTMGQIKQVGKHYYKTDLDISLIKEEIIMDTLHVTFQLKFDNRAYAETLKVDIVKDNHYLPVKADLMFEIFPFCMAFDSEMRIKSTGISLRAILPLIIGRKLNETFDLIRPLVEFKYSTILARRNNIFELMTAQSIWDLRGKSPTPSHLSGQEVMPFSGEEVALDQERKLHLKGQMLFLNDWKMIVYLGTPVMNDLDSMISSGLFLNDLSMHDFSRDLMMAGTQQSVELKLLLDQEQLKSKKLEESMKKLDEEMKRTDELLYQMIPKQVADRLRKGANPVDTCQNFDLVTILFSDVVTFTEISSRITPMEVVCMLNDMYSLFDKLTEMHGVYKVETIGDAYMVVGGVPVWYKEHALKICDMALDMVEGITYIKDPSTGNPIRIRVGVHSGPVVAGVVGLKMPRYCLFGDTVNTASRMESNSEALKVHISHSTKERLDDSYSISERGEIQVKGKGNMKTYWLHSKADRKPFNITLLSDATPPEQRSHRMYSPVTFKEVSRGNSAASRRFSMPHTDRIQPISLSNGSAEPSKPSSVELRRSSILQPDGLRLLKPKNNRVHHQVIEVQNRSSGEIKRYIVQPETKVTEIKVKELPCPFPSAKKNAVGVQVSSSDLAVKRSKALAESLSVDTSCCLPNHGPKGGRSVTCSIS